MIYGEGYTNVRMTFADALIRKRRFPDEIYFIAYPNFEEANEEQQTRLSYVYDTKDVIRVEHGGYSVDVYHYVKKVDLR